MPLVSLSTSSARAWAFEAGLQHLVDLGRISQLPSVDAHPQPIYTLKLDDVDKGRDRDIGKAATLVGWRFFAHCRGGGAVTGNVDLSSPPNLTDLRWGPLAEAAVKATQAVEKLDQIAKNPYQLRVLRIPRAHVEAFWLVPTPMVNGSEDLIVPYHITFLKQADLEPDYTVAKFYDCVIRLKKPDAVPQGA